MPATTTESATRPVKTAERVLDLIDYLRAAEAGATFGKITHDLAVPKSSLHGLLQALSARDYIEFDPSTRRYALGIRVWEAGAAYERRRGVIEVAQPVLEAVVATVNETAQLASLAGAENVYLAKVDSPHPLRMQSEVGRRLSAHATGIGKALLAQLTDDDIRQRFDDGPLPVYTSTTLADTASLLAEIAATRARGFAIDNEEYTPGLFCLAVPIPSSSEIGSTALSVSIPTSRITPETLSAILSEIARASLQISARMGRPQPDPMLHHLSNDQTAARAIATLFASEHHELGFPARSLARNAR